MTSSLRETQDAVNALYAPHLRAGAADPYHATIRDFLARCSAMKCPRVLEIGSREVSGISRRHLFPTASRYVGFDLHPGPGVDVVGDIHELSQHFAAGSFDVVFSMSVFEHLAFPWKAAMEINRVLARDGLCFVSTHPVWPPHELPWDFWRFPVRGLKLLFCEPLGFVVEAAEEGLPAKLHSLVDDPPTRGVSDCELPMGVALVARKVADYDPARFRWDLPLPSVLNTLYPQPA